MTLQEMRIRKTELNLTYREISEKARVPLATVQKILGGVTASPRHETMLRLERVLGKGAASAGLPCAESRAEEAVIQEPRTAYGDAVVRKDPEKKRESYRFLPGKKQGDYTVEDTARLPEEVHVELIDGHIYDMGEPSENHQTLVVEITSEIRNYLKRKGFPCRVLPGPYAVRLFPDSIKTSVSPDISVICDERKRTPKGCVGAPDWIIEILSPVNPGHDFVRKLNLYADAGVREYWIVDPMSEKVYVFPLEKHSTRAVEYSFQDTVPAGICQDLGIDFSEIEPLLG